MIDIFLFLQFRRIVNHQRFPVGGDDFVNDGGGGSEKVNFVFTLNTFPHNFHVQ